MNEVTVRIKVNKRLEAAGWRFLAVEGKPANIRQELNVTVKTSAIDCQNGDSNCLANEVAHRASSGERRPDRGGAVLRGLDRGLRGTLPSGEKADYDVILCAVGPVSGIPTWTTCSQPQ